MARLLGIRIKNYRALADVRLGQVDYGKGTPLPSLAAFIGRNGAGKSTLLDAFSFIADCLLDGVEAACDKAGRGGIKRIKTQGATDPIEFELFFRDTDEQRPIVYKLSIDAPDEIPMVMEESLRQRRAGQVRGKPFHFLKVERGTGKVWAGDALDADKDSKKSESVQLADRNRLGIATLGNLSEHPRIVRFRSYIEQWYLSYFVPDAARTLPPAGAQRFLDRQGSNVGNVLQYLQRQHKKSFGQILANVARAIPGLNKIEPSSSADGRLLLRFDEQGYRDPFFQQSMSDGTLKMLAYSVLLADPEPRPFIGIEEPENGLYVELLEHLARQFNEHVSAPSAKTQILVTTHSPYFVDALKPEQVWVIKKDEQGRAQLRRAADIRGVQELVAQELPLGSLWYSKHLDAE